jgi:DNA-binding transcriptional regulator LsrR (DeoR family)
MGLHMKVKRTKTHEIEARRRKVARLYARKITQTEIAQSLGVDQATVSRDVQAIEAQWRREAQAEVGAIRAQELAELREMERYAVSHQTKASSDRDRARWVAERLKIKARVAALMGLDAPVVLEHTGKDGGPIDVRYVNDWRAHGT